MRPSVVAEQSSIGLRPGDASGKLGEIPISDPIDLRLEPPLGEFTHRTDRVRLDRKHLLDQARCKGQAVGTREEFDATDPIGGLRVAEPAQAFVVATEWGGVFEGVRHIEHGGSRAGEVPVIPSRQSSSP